MGIEIVTENEATYYYKDLQMRLERQKRYQEIVKKNMKDWADFSLNPQTEDAIRERVLHDLETGDNTYCMTYICTFSKLSEEFIEELYQLTRRRKGGGTKLYDNKLDWVAISSKQKLSESFIERHAKDVDWRSIYQFQDLSDEIRIKHLDKLTVADRPKS
jgi:hypothetical protein